MSFAIDFNHAMIYTADVSRSLGFYRDRLGFEVIEIYRNAYARLKSGSGTIAIHLTAPDQQVDPAREGVRLYFEVQDLEAFCEHLRQQGVEFDQLPKRMPWGWRHAYLRDPDGHEISLYWAGQARFEKTAMAE
jgi:catechol 2,3-dioxygenase-like lactoylglutathione lyase family enzyme